MKKNEIKGLTFYLALWDDDYGPLVLNSFPEKQDLDIEQNAIRVFQSFQLIYGDETDTGFNKTDVLLPFKSDKLKAKILFHSIENKEIRGGRQPFISVILVSEEYLNDDLKIFDQLLNKCATIFIKDGSVDIKSLYSEAADIFSQFLEESEGKIEIENRYSFVLAVNDFKKGLEFYKSNDFDNSYMLIRKALLKFNLESNYKLMVECNILLSTIFFLKKKYSAALKYYIDAYAIAKELNHVKYIEQSLFMSAFCEFKLFNYSSSLTFLDKIDPTSLNFIKPLQFYNVSGRIYDGLNMEKQAINAYDKALQIIDQLDTKKSNSILRQQSQILFSIGLLNYNIAVISLKTLGISHKDVMEEYLNRSIENLEKSTEIFREIQDSVGLIKVYGLISKIYGLLGNSDEEFIYLKLSLEISIELNDFPLQVNLVNKIFGLNERFGKYQQNIIEIQSFFKRLTTKSFIDLFTISKFHLKLGDSFVAIDNEQNALDEYLLALTLHNRMSRPAKSKIDVLNRIIKIYENQKEEDKIIYYLRIKKKTIDQLKEFTKIQINKGIYRPMGDLKELWVISNSGTEWFSYVPETQMDPDLLSGFMTALQSFSKELSNDQLNSLVIGKNRYNVYGNASEKYYFLGRSDIRSSEYGILKILKKMEEIFRKTYSETINNFRHNISPFKNFMHVLEEYDLENLS